MLFQIFGDHFKQILIAICYFSGLKMLYWSKTAYYKFPLNLLPPSLTPRQRKQRCLSSSVHVVTIVIAARIITCCRVLFCKDNVIASYYSVEVVSYAKEQVRTELPGYEGAQGKRKPGVWRRAHAWNVTLWSKYWKTLGCYCCYCSCAAFLAFLKNRS